MSEEEVDVKAIKPLKVHEKAWTQKQLLQRIVARHFDVLEDIGELWPAWLVRARIQDEEHENPHDALEILNEHLAELDWMARLTRDEPWKVTIFPSPPSLFALQDVHRLFFWIAALLSTWIMGVVWLLPLHAGTEWTDPAILRAGLLSYALPMMACLGLADLAHRYVAKRMQVRVGGLLPLALPLPYPGWPFGLFAIPSHPRMESIPWPDRRKLGWVSLAAPLVLLVGGLVLVLVGLWLTPTERTIGEQPSRLGFGLLAQLLASLIWEPEVLSLKTAWTHPMALAGHGLMLVAWVSLLPIPTFPGGRIIVAMSGMESARSQGSQILLFIAVMSLGFLLGAFTGHVIWTFVVIAGGMLIATQGGDDRIPLILDDVRPLSEDSARRLSMALVVGLLLTIPAEMPTLELEEWDEGLEWELPASTLFSDFNTSDGFSIVINNPGLLNQEWTLSATVQGLAEQWNLSWECPDGESSLIEGCQGILRAEESIIVHLKWFTPPIESSPVPLLLNLLHNEKDSHEVILQADAELSPIAPTWTVSGDLQEPVLCTGLQVSKDSQSFNLSLSSSDSQSSESSLWRIVEPLDLSIEDNATEYVMDICIEGEAGSLFHGVDTLRLQAMIDSGVLYSWSLEMPATIGKFVFPSDGWRFGQHDELVSWENASNWSISGAMGWAQGDDLLVSDELLCSDGGVWRQPNQNEDGWTWDSNVQKRVDWPNLSSGNLNWTGSAANWLHLCSDEVQSWEMVEGPAVILIDDGVARMDWINTGWSINSSKSGSMELQFIDLQGGLVFDERSHGNGSGWLSHIQETDGIEVTLTLNWQSSDDMLMAWIELTDGQIQLHLAAWDVG